MYTRGGVEGRLGAVSGVRGRQLLWVPPIDPGEGPHVRVIVTQIQLEASGEDGEEASTWLTSRGGRWMRGDGDDTQRRHSTPANKKNNQSHFPLIKVFDLLSAW